ncbi:substrate-binding domain-containing protein, partial [Rhizobium johnstonii]|uniref:substrate-binding domain-containing protein n=1 Tax=Rhizobium johnstonii TaxID=3019933 RepID=UPI003F9B5D4D
RPLTALETVEDAANAPTDTPVAELVAAMEKRWVIGAPDAAAAAIRDLASRYGVDEVMAIGLMQAAAGNGTIVPDALSVAGFDDIFGSELISPPLKTVRAQLELAGHRAVQSL